MFMEIITQELDAESNLFEIVGRKSDITIEADNVIKDDIEYAEDKIIYQFQRNEEFIATVLRREGESDTVMVNNGCASITRVFEGNKVKVEEFMDRLDEV